MAKSDTSRSRCDGIDRGQTTAASLELSTPPDVVLTCDERAVTCLVGHMLCIPSTDSTQTEKQERAEVKNRKMAGV